MLDFYSFPLVFQEKHSNISYSKKQTKKDSQKKLRSYLSPKYTYNVTDQI